MAAARDPGDGRRESGVQPSRMLASLSQPRSSALTPALSISPEPPRSRSPADIPAQRRSSALSNTPAQPRSPPAPPSTREERGQSIQRKPVPFNSTRECEGPHDHADIATPPVRKSSIKPPAPPRVSRAARWAILRDALWLWELGSLLLACAAAAALVALLATNQGKPLPDWPSLVSINSLVSILTSAMKASLLLPIAECISELKWTWFATAHPVSDFDRFDAASRGPLGATKFLGKRPRHLASLGAVITILAIAIDPFTQQVLQYYNCLTPAYGVSATVARANMYEIVFPGTNQRALDAPMDTALYEGLLEPPANSSVGVSYSCPSGNCTFTSENNVAYRSLAVCVHVEDLTSQVEADIDTSAADSLDNPVWSYTLKPDSTNVSIQQSGGGSLLTVNAISNPSTIFKQRPPDSFFAMAALMLTGPGNDIWPSIQNGSLKPFAFGASLYPCIQTYSGANVTNFVLNENISTTTPLSLDGFDFSLAGNYASLPGVDCTPSTQPTSSKIIVTLPLPNGQRVINYTEAATHDPAARYYDPACTWRFFGGSAIPLNDTLSGQFFSAPTIDANGNAINGPRSLEIDDTGASLVIGDTWLQRLYNSHSANLTSATEYMQGLADEMTTVVRARGDATYGGGQAKGVIMANQTCVQVQWAWLALPAVVLVLAIVFLIITVVQTRRHLRQGGLEAGRGAWKSSALPLLWCGLPEGVRASKGSLNQVEDMKICGDGVYVRLCREGYSSRDTLLTTEGDEKESRWLLAEDTDSRAGAK